MSERASIIATIGPASSDPAILAHMLDAGMNVARINFAWFDPAAGEDRIDGIRAVASAHGHRVPIIADLPGPRVQAASGHTYDANANGLPEKDAAAIVFCIEKQVEYIAVSFVGAAEDMERYRRAVAAQGGSIKLIAKIERRVALDHLDEIIAASDAVMIARGDLGAEVPLEEIPFIQETIIKKANALHKPVIVATQMMLSMTTHPEPTRAEVSDVAEAVKTGADAVMLSEETASGEYPVEAVTMMARIITETERHQTAHALHPL